MRVYPFDLWNTLLQSAQTKILKSGFKRSSLCVIFLNADAITDVKIPAGYGWDFL